jgi:hypothetical protein
LPLFWLPSIHSCHNSQSIVKITKMESRITLLLPICNCFHSSWNKIKALTIVSKKLYYLMPGQSLTSMTTTSFFHNFPTTLALLLFHTSTLAWKVLSQDLTIPDSSLSLRSQFKSHFLKEDMANRVVVSPFCFILLFNTYHYLIFLKSTYCLFLPPVLHWNLKTM